MEEGLKMLYNDRDILKMMEDISSISILVVYMKYDVDKIDLDLVEAPPALPSTQ